MTLKELFRLEKKPVKGLLAAEWVVLGYMVLTILLMLCLFTELTDPKEMLWGRVQIFIVTMALWAVYRMVPCRFTYLCRIVVQLALLSWWYPDTYEFNRLFPNLDHLFARWEQSWFECQPALLFSKAWSHPVFSELMDMGYAVYYPLIGLVALYFFWFRYDQFGRASFVILAAFFAYYIIYIALPVAGPQYYFKAVGVEEIAQGIFPNVGHYFATHSEALTSPGYHDGVFYQMVVDAHNAGERPTAAFPSSHVGITTILMLLLMSVRNYKLLLWLTPFYVLLCLSTVYIQAHYAVDVLGGWVSAILFYLLFSWLYTRRALL